MRSSRSNLLFASGLDPLGPAMRPYAKGVKIERRSGVSFERCLTAILAKAFRGELVPQDENDEPADVLLDRISAERAAAPKQKRGRRSLGMAQPYPERHEGEQS